MIVTRFTKYCILKPISTVFPYKFFFTKRVFRRVVDADLMITQAALVARVSVG